MRCRLALALLALAASACGPSLRGVADGGAFFERCYSADFDSRVPVAEKRECWERWTEHYTAGQTPDRVRYAEARLAAIERGEPSPRMPGLPEAALGPESATPVSVSSGGEGAASADAAIVDEGDEGLGDESEEGDAEASIARERRPRREMPLPRNSNPQCAAVACEPEYRACLDVCPRGDGACETACVVSLRACARGCF